MEKINNSFDELRKTIELNQSIAISGHTSPDGDAIGACAALGMALQMMGKEVVVLLEPYGEVFNFIPTGGLIRTVPPEEAFIPDLYITLDCGDRERLGPYGEIFDRTLSTINMDHHISNTYFAKENYVDCDASSASEIVFQFLYGYGPIDEDIAAALYSGIVYDTGGFRHQSTTPVTMAIVSALMEYEFDFNGIYNALFHSRSFTEAKMMGRALLNAELVLDGSVGTSFVTMADMAAENGDSDDVNEVSGYLNGIRGTLATVFLYEKEAGTFKVSMRSQTPVDVSAVAVKFGGGGHKLAAGCTISGEREEILKTILEEIEKQL